MKIDLDFFRNECYAQWQATFTCDGPYDVIKNVVTVPFLALATLSSEVMVPLRWTFHYLFYSRNDRLRAEYKILKAQDAPLSNELFKTALEHPNRNRYSNVLPNEPTRVRFKNEEEYFNANWVLGKRAIACQGPLPDETFYFWKMVQETGVKTIVMLTNEVENGRTKCNNYWQSSWSFFKQPSEEVFENKGEKIVRRELPCAEGTVVQYHLQNWPDHGVVHPKTLAELVKIVSQREGPILVHCSAGIGRTGTFLAALEAYCKKSWNIFSIAKSLRNPWTGRVGMIQQPEQYLLAHDTLQLLLS